MTYGPVERPAPSDKKIKTSDDFELCFLRHQYFRRAKYNPTEAEMQPYMAIIQNLTKNTFFTYYNLFRCVGMDHDDILNIGRVHLTSFLGLYSLEKMDTKKQEFSERFERYEFRQAVQDDFDQKNKANFTLFFKQRMEELVRICRQKARNIKGVPSEEFQIFCGESKPPRYPRSLLKRHTELGYKKVDFSVFRAIRKRSGVGSDATIFQFDNLWYIAVALEQKNLELEDIIGSGSNPYDNVHNMRPDQLFEEKQSEGLCAGFHKKSSYRKRVTLRNFIAKNQNNRQYREEIATAKRLLKGLGD
jgi:hypothetical protein